MKKIVILLLFVSALTMSHAQTPSSCLSTQLLSHEYELDIKNLVLRRMLQLQNPDTVLVNIPQTWQDTISEGIAAIFNAVTIAERDTVFNLYCVHDNTTPQQVYQSMLISVDTSYAWTDAWQNLTSLTGNPNIDAMVTKYDLQVDQFYNWSFGNYAELSTDSLWNIYALMDSLEKEPGVIYAEANSIIGSAGKITYDKVGSERFYNFYFEFNDCFDGCDNYRMWQFKVNADCSVEYLGFIDWGVFGISPLPFPVNCNTFTSINEHVSDKLEYVVYPNPVSSTLIISAANAVTNNFANIYDVTGRLLLNTKRFFGTEKIDLANLPDGLYFLKIINEDTKTSVYKIIKQ